MGNHDHHTCSGNKNDFTSHAKVEIDMAGLHSKLVAKVSSFSCNLTLLEINFKEEYNHVAG